MNFKGGISLKYSLSFEDDIRNIYGARAVEVANNACLKLKTYQTGKTIDVAELTKRSLTREIALGIFKHLNDGVSSAKFESHVNLTRSLETLLEIWMNN